MQNKYLVILSKVCSDKCLLLEKFAKSFTTVVSNGRGTAYQGLFGEWFSNFQETAVFVILISNFSCIVDKCIVAFFRFFHFLNAFFRRLDRTGILDYL